jgi:hypothetical protein
MIGSFVQFRAKCPIPPHELHLVDISRSQYLLSCCFLEESMPFFDEDEDDKAFDANDMCIVRPSNDFSFIVATQFNADS